MEQKIEEIKEWFELILFIFGVFFSLFLKRFFKKSYDKATLEIINEPDPASLPDISNPFLDIRKSRRTFPVCIRRNFKIPTVDSVFTDLSRVLNFARDQKFDVFHLDFNCKQINTRGVECILRLVEDVIENNRIELIIKYPNNEYFAKLATAVQNALTENDSGLICMVPNNEVLK